MEFNSLLDVNKPGGNLMNTQPVQNKKCYKKSKIRLKKRRRRRRFLFFTIMFIACIFIVQAIQKKYEKNNAADNSLPSLASANGSISAKEKSARKNFIICIDPGHGYDDPGCDSEYLGDYSEKDINLSISKLIRDKLQENGFTVIMTRDSDIKPDDLKPNNIGMYTISSKAVTDFSNANGSDLFLSIHCNYFKDKNINGTRLYYYIDNTETTESYANLLSNGINNILGEECLVSANDKKEAYTVCYYTEAPAVLAEVGFVSNPEDAKKLLDSAWKDKYAESIVEGMINYFKEFCYNTSPDVNNAK
jgi:N-acetylmuramoyl-L-alanine amidase